MAGALVEELAEVKASTLLIPTANAWLMRHGDRVFYEYRVFQMVGAPLAIFHYPLVKGDPATALTEPSSAILTETTAVKYFGQEDPIGKQIVADDGWATLTVTGVMRDPSDPSHIQGDMFIVPPNIDLTKYWGEPEVYSYVRLASGVHAADVEAKIPLVLNKYLPVTQPDKAFEDVKLQPITDIHLFSRFPDEFSVTGDISTLYLLAGLALALLVVAVVNFINLTTARAAGRMKEIGVRKVTGAGRHHLVFQFLGEAVILSCLAGGLSVVLTILILPWFNDLSGQALKPAILGSTPVLAGLAILVLLTGLSAGGYPAIQLSSYPPLAMFGRLTSSGQSRKRLRQGLVTGQFAVAMLLIMGAGTLAQQIDHLQSRRIGLQPDQVLVVRDFGQGAILQQFDAMRQALKQYPDVVDATRTSFLPGVRMGGEMLLNSKTVTSLSITSGFIETFGIELLSGEGFAAPSKPPNYIISRATARIMGWTPDEAIGQSITLFSKRGDGGMGFPASTIVGVVDDFQIDSLRRPVGALVLAVRRNDGFFGASPFIKLKTTDLPATLTRVEDVWHEYLPNTPFDYVFLDETFSQLYRAEIRLCYMSSALAFIATLVALLGVFGLTAYMTERRTKEVGIRRILGASTVGLVRLLCQEMMVLVLISNLVAWPLAYLLLRRWLEQFAYRIEVNPGLFILASLVTLALAQLTVGYHAIRTASTNPVETLRDG